MANPPLSAQSTDGNVAGILGENSGNGGRAVMGSGTGNNGTGIFGKGLGFGVVGESSNGPGLSAFSETNVGAHGQSKSAAGVRGVSDTAPGVTGESNHQPGVLGIGHIPQGRGVQGQIQGAHGEFTIMGFIGGRDPQFNQNAGVYGQSDQQGVMGLTAVPKGTGVYGGGTTAAGGDQIGVRGETITGVGVQGQSFGEGVAIQGQSLSGDKGLAGRFIGNVHIQGNPGTSSGDLRVEGTSSFGGNSAFQGSITAFDVVLSGGDCAEDFDITGSETVDPGTVMVIDDEGTLRPCKDAYDKKVTGVISGAGDHKPGIILDKRVSTSGRLPLALVGKVYCKVDADFGAIQVGDLLTTSTTNGHAMKARDVLNAFGAVIGKALQPITAGRGLIAILVALQ